MNYFFSGVVEKETNEYAQCNKDKMKAANLEGEPT